MVSELIQNHGIFSILAHKWNPQEVDINEHLLTNVLIAEEIFSDPETQKKGVAVVIDRSGVGFNHFRATIGPAIRLLPSFFVNSNHLHANFNLLMRYKTFFLLLAGLFSLFIKTSTFGECSGFFIFPHYSTIFI